MNDNELKELEDWFRSAPAPAVPLYLDPATKVNDYANFVNAHFEGLRAASNALTKDPLLARLKKMKAYIEENV